MSFNRRQFLLRSSLLSLALVPSVSVARALRARPAAEAEGAERFLLFVIIPGGLDSTYLLDARPREFTARGLLANYRPADETLVRWGDPAGPGDVAWGTPLAAPLHAQRDVFTVLNGVHTPSTFDGHVQHLNLLFAGSAFGGESFVPAANLKSPLPLDGVLSGPIEIEVSNHAGVVPLNASAAAALVQAAARRVREPELAIDRWLQDRFGRLAGDANSALRADAAAMRGAGELGPDLAGRLARWNLAGLPGDDDHLDFVRIAMEAFRTGSSRAGIVKFQQNGATIDTHDAASASRLAGPAGDYATFVAKVFELLRATPFDARRSFLDVTTVVATSEFGRTMRQLNHAIDQTGTDHNAFGYTMLVGGAGIRGGQVLGATDWATPDEALSGAHREVDPLGVKLVGRPFDFATGRSRVATADAPGPQAYRAADYLTQASVVNTVLSLFAAPAERLRKLERLATDVAPTIAALLKR